jgi:DNA-binding response OmpR family regulator
VVDTERQEIRLYGEALDLTVTEFRLLSLMGSRPERLYSWDRLLECLHDEGQAVSDRTADSHI